MRHGSRPAPREGASTSRRALLASALALPFALSACVPAIVAVGVGTTALVATDPRTTGTQVDDEGIELKIGNQVNTQFGDKVHVNATAYNGIVLLTGEVPDQGTWASVGAIAKGTEKVRLVQNELVVAPNSTLSQRTNDTYITSKVKTRFIEANKFPPNAVKVTTERAVVYLMGIVSRSVGNTAGEIAAGTEGVARVVKVFEYRGA
jgi:osmotically-inducible protein OsmY